MTEKPMIEPTYRLHVKKNYKGKIAWEYSVKGDTMDEIDARSKAMLEYIKNNIEPKEEDGNEED